MRHVWQWGVLTLFVGACGFSGGGADGLPANCQAGTLICDGEVSKTCGTNGEWDPALDRTCDLACSAGVCITASNVPMARVLACGADAPALKPPAGATVTLGPGTPGIPGTAASLQCNPDCGRPGVTVIESSPMIEAGDVDLAWFCLSELSLAEGVTLNLFDRALTTPYAIAIGVAGEATLRGEVDLTGAAATSANRGLAGPGGGAGSSQSDSDGGSGGGGVCGGKGGLRRNGTLLAAGGGGGGGGHGMDGGAGGAGQNDLGAPAVAGVAGTMCGSAELTPLSGGGGGGGGADGSCGTGVTCGWPGGGGGGALQIFSRRKITVSGRINASGGAGYGANASPNGIGGGGGGGAGGAILLEAPEVTITGKLVAQGGEGGASAAGLGGVGAAETSPGAGTSASVNNQGGAGGGGAGGRIRINATEARCPPIVSPTNACTAGPMRPAS